MARFSRWLESWFPLVLLKKIHQKFILTKQNLDIFNTAPARGSPFSSSGQFKEKFTVNDSNLWVKIKSLGKDQTSG